MEDVHLHLEIVTDTAPGSDTKMSPPEEERDDQCGDKNTFKEYFARPVAVDSKGNLCLKGVNGSLQDIIKHLGSNDLFIPKASFVTLVEGICTDNNISCRWHQDALTALQQSFEQYAIQIFKIANQITTIDSRVTLERTDFMMAVEISILPLDLPSSNN